MNDESAPTQAVVDQCVQEFGELLRERESVSIKTAEVSLQRARGARRRWALLAVLTIVVSVGELIVLVLPRPDIAPEPPAKVLSVEASNLCAQRQVEILTAVRHYMRDRGAPPSQLSGLGPPYLLHPWVDPVSGKPYLYSQEGNSVLVRCPNPELHAFGSKKVVRRPIRQDHSSFV